MGDIKVGLGITPNHLSNKVSIFPQINVHQDWHVLRGGGLDDQRCNPLGLLACSTKSLFHPAYAERGIFLWNIKQLNPFKALPAVHFDLLFNIFFDKTSV